MRSFEDLRDRVKDLRKLCLARELDERQTHPFLPNGAGSSGALCNGITTSGSGLGSGANLRDTHDGGEWTVRTKPNAYINPSLDGRSLSTVVIAHRAQQRNYLRTNKRSFAGWHVPVVVVVLSALAAPQGKL
uniref:Uncharacterized protein n=1 Tax=Anopheles merus TaxID=30066 RepID=A0A182UZ46_ANOME